MSNVAYASSAFWVGATICSFYNTKKPEKLPSIQKAFVALNTIGIIAVFVNEKSAPKAAIVSTIAGTIISNFMFSTKRDPSLNPLVRTTGFNLGMAAYAITTLMIATVKMLANSRSPNH
jgi:hypothetical protein